MDLQLVRIGLTALEKKCNDLKNQISTVHSSRSARLDEFACEKN
ncbi:hypothetical protein SAMN06265379_1206 [Saccharicrinis carchari]|uniref:Uncharacterized protein n=1 Tax=Saccharicrinis carchari TaxID=1168039 RepID=A0A521FBN2_SACCC|nr:hypothetical protein SAMN06265379_1206 [Saccharicrinis carchari]